MSFQSLEVPPSGCPGGRELCLVLSNLALFTVHATCSVEFCSATIILSFSHTKLSLSSGYKGDFAEQAINTGCTVKSAERRCSLSWSPDPGRLGAHLCVRGLASQLLHGFRDDGHGMLHTCHVLVSDPGAFASTLYVVQRALEAAVLIYHFLDKISQP